MNLLTLYYILNAFVTLLFLYYTYPVFFSSVHSLLKGLHYFWLSLSLFVTGLYFFVVGLYKLIIFLFSGLCVYAVYFTIIVYILLFFF
jgi:hypothetical protein